MTDDGADPAVRARLMARLRQALLRNDLAALREVACELRGLCDRAGGRGARVGLRCPAPRAPDPFGRPPADDAP
jgi:hypothetical protein